MMNLMILKCNYNRYKRKAKNNVYSIVIYVQGNIYCIYYNEYVHTYMYIYMQT